MCIQVAFVLFKKRKPKKRSIFQEKVEKVKRPSSQSGVDKSEEQEVRIFRLRVFLGCLVVALCFLILFGNLYYLQVMSHEDYQTRSNVNRIRVLPVVPQRGIIYDRNHVVLAENRPVFHLIIFPNKEISTLDTVRNLDRLMKLGLTQADIDNILALSRTRQRFKGVEIADSLSEDQISTFSVNRHKYPNVQISSDLKRYYPFSSTTTHAIGYVSRINADDVEKLTEQGKIENYEGTSAIGKLGIERFYEDELHGTTGSREVEVNSHGQILRTLKYNPPVHGRDITLTLDIRLQYYAQELLGDMKGAIVAMEPATGGILAFYSNPSYDPNLFVRGIRTREYSALLNNPGRPLINRVTQGGYSPASTIKPLLAIMGLNEGLITPTSSFFGGPSFSLPGSTHRFRDWRAWGHGWLDVYRAISLSADTFFYDLAHRATIDTINKYLDLYGFGKASGIDIHEESLGINPSQEWKLRRYKQGWHIGDTIPIGIGQGYWTTTLIQLVKANAMLANHGRFVTPHLMKDVVDPKSMSIIHNFEDPDTGKRLKVKDKSYFDVARAGMYLVINSSEGTGRRAFAKTEYKAAGKSGTAQIVAIKQGEKYDASALKTEHRDNALFVAFAPYYRPRILVGIILENEGGGSSVAAPVVRKIMDRYFELYPSGYMGEKVPQTIKFGMGGTVEVK